MITQGSPEQVAKFREDKQLPFECYSDQQRTVYKAFGLGKAGLRQMMAGSVMAAGPKALFRGGLGVPQGDIKQMSGSFVIDQQGNIRLAYYSKTIADNPSNDLLLETFRRP